MRSIKLDITNKAGMRLAVAESAAAPSYRRRGVTIASASLALHRLRLRPAPRVRRRDGVVGRLVERALAEPLATAGRREEVQRDALRRRPLPVHGRIDHERQAALMFDDRAGQLLANRVGHGVAAALHPAGRGSGVELHLLPSTLGGYGRSAVARVTSWEEAHYPSAHHAMVSTVSHALNVGTGEPSS